MRILFLGDLHRNFNLLEHYVRLYDIKDAHIVQVGDFGVGFSTFERELEILKNINKTLETNNVFVWAIRGNHDDPEYFENDPFNLTNIKLVKDYSVLEIANRRILCIGGAVSVDRMVSKTQAQLDGDNTRIIGQRWILGEEFKYDDSLLVDLRGIDTIVTHTVPDYCTPDNSMGFGPFVDHFIMEDPELKLDLLEERRNMTLAFQTVKMHNDIVLHLYGHFHRSDELNIMGTKHRLLDVGELWEER